MTIKSTFVWTSVHTIIKILAGMIMNKVIAVYLGPSGLAMISQFQNFVQMVRSIANGSIQTGIIKYTAEHREDEKYLNKILKNSLFINLFLSFSVSLFLFLFAGQLSQKVMFSSDFLQVFYFLAFSMVFYSLNLYIISILNGLGEIKLYTIINIVISIITLIFTSLLTIIYKLNGALFAIVLVQSSVFIVSYILVYKKFGNKFFSYQDIINNIDKKIMRKLFKFSIATYTLGSIEALLMISMRYMITNQISLNEAGVWEGAWRIKLYFSMLFMLPFSIYYFPKFSYSNNFDVIKKYLFEALKYLMPFAIVAALFMYIFRDLMIEVLFSREFFGISNILGYILAGEIIRMLGSFLINVFMAKAMIFTVIALESVFAISLLGFSCLFIGDYRLLGLGYAYLIASTIFLLLSIFKFKLFPKGIA